MPLPISAISTVPLTSGKISGNHSDGGFQKLLGEAIDGVECLRTTAHQTVFRFLTGEGEEVHSVALATQRAELAFETFVQMRNKVVSAYQSIMQMQI